jgi:flagellar biosynthesis protein FlhG
MNPLNPLKSSLSDQVGDASISETRLFDALPSPQHSRVKQVWAVGGGKGGVGKSLIASSLAIALARTGEKVTAIDLDLGGSNLHTSLGVELPKLTLSDFLNGGTASLQDLAVPSGISQLNIISGAQDSMGVAQIDATAKRRVLEAVPQIDSDYVVFDLGAGTSFSTLDFYLYADLGVIILLPEPTSIENAYRFIKSSYYRHLWHAPSLREIRPLIEQAMDTRNTRGIRSPSDLFREVNTQSSELGLKLKIEIEKFRPKLIVNQARTQADIDIGFSVKAVCRKYFGIDMDYVGYLDYDSAVWQAVRRKRPLFLEFPNSRLVSSIERVVQYMIKNCSTQRSGLR